MKHRVLFGIGFLLATVASISAHAHGGGGHPPLAGHLPFKNNTVHLHATFAAEPEVGTEAFLSLEAKDAKTHQPVDLQDDVEVSLFMPTMGHGSAPTQVERVLDSKGNVLPGVFNVRSMYFTMAGDWDVSVTLTDASAVNETQKFSVHIDGQPGQAPHRH
jgi:hypothetical protein